GPTVSLGEGELHLGVAASKCGSDARNEGSLCILGKTNPKRCRVNRGDSAGFHDHHVQLSKLWASSRIARPASVNATRFRSRWNRRTPMVASRSAIWWLREGCVMNRRSAALWKLSSWASVTNDLICRSSMVGRNRNLSDIATTVYSPAECNLKI